MTECHHDEVVTIPRDEYESLKAEVRRLRREVGRQQAMQAVMDNAANPDQVRTFTRDELSAEWGIVAGEALQETDYLLRSPANARRLIESYREAIEARYERHELLDEEAAR
ncbi:hypothetical protein ABZ897_42440 [Nonomuraea sp. NPDC046802]|uniref:hypothetical protein n=1 Tax=Nonomuraea sp. NPDC046802 TaxID=3154919 RepID=UPI00340BCDA9